jgi:hypothetical protein
MLCRRTLLVAVLVGLTANPAAGSTAFQLPATDPIVVTGTRSSPEEARRIASQFVRAAGVGVDDRPVARWQEPVCISIRGLRDEYGAMLRRRMQRVAEETGVRLAPGGCAPNIVVNFTFRPLDALRNLQAHRPYFFHDISPAERAAVFADRVPIRWVYSTTMTTFDGREMTTGAQVAGPTMLGIDVTALGSETPITFGYGASGVSSGVARVLRGATVIVDLGALNGQSMAGLGDYISMVAFAEMRSREAMPADSILNLFSQMPSHSLTLHDRAFLSILYRLPLDRGGRRHRAIMMRELVAAMTDAGTARQ